MEIVLMIYAYQYHYKRLVRQADVSPAGRNFSASCPKARQARGQSQCEHTCMNSRGESPTPPGTSNGRAANGNCVVMRRGGEQPKAEPWSQTKVNSIRPTASASLLGKGEACRVSGETPRTRTSFEKRGGDAEGGWSENVAKGTCGRVESCPGRNPYQRGRAAVRAAIGAMKRGNARGAKGGREVERPRP